MLMSYYIFNCMDNYFFAFQWEVSIKPFQQNSFKELNDKWIEVKQTAKFL